MSKPNPTPGRLARAHSEDAGCWWQALARIGQYVAMQRPARWMTAPGMHGWDYAGMANDPTGGVTPGMAAQGRDYSVSVDPNCKSNVSWLLPKDPKP